MRWVFVIMIVPMFVIFAGLLFSFLSSLKADANEMMKKAELANQNNSH